MSACACVRCDVAPSRRQPSDVRRPPPHAQSYEASPFVKVVREALCEREIAHVFRSCARGSPKRQELFEQRGHFQARAALCGYACISGRRCAVLASPSAPIPRQPDPPPHPPPRAFTCTQQVPYLEDPNQGVCMWESAQIVRYIDDTYAA